MNLTQAGEVIRLENERLALTVLPECGAKIASLVDRRTGREWLWHNPHLAISRPNGSGRYVQEADSGGWDECFPNVAAGPGFPDHGLLWQERWHTIARSGELMWEGGVRLATLGAEVTRRITLADSAPAIRVEYRLQNETSQELAFVWASHPLFRIEDGMRLEIEGMRDLRVASTDGTLPAMLTPLQAGGAMALHATGDMYLGKFFCAAVGFRLYNADGTGIRFRWDGGGFQGIACWVNGRGWSGSGSPPYLNIGIEPTIGLCDAPWEAGHAVGTLAPRGVMEWSLDVELTS